MKIYLMRHGTTVWNKQKKIQGLADINLDKDGIEEVLKVKEKLKDVTFDLVFSSPLKRAKQTASLITNNSDLLLDDLLLEIDFGDYESRSYLNIEQKKDDPLYNFFFRPELYIPSNGEKISSVRKRSKLFFLKLKEKYKDKDINILVVSHSIFIRSTLLNIENLETSELFSKTSVNNASYRILEDF